ncbi:dTDP-4-dehydrorhamnose 3,5-epimerase [Candidatus Sumerlaeota bacterium]|nr:dTDP-4-dehydrorhamnose 3,5-epimerase [Candidatus Sumerlaeota bacterium]
MKFSPGPLDGLVIIEPRVFADPRGFFLESFRRDEFTANGIHCDFVQDNHSCSRRGTVRGLHFQTSPGQAKLIRCTAGVIWDVAVDIRRGSPSFGQWFGIELGAENKKMIFIPVGFAHGFAVLSDDAEVQYQCSAYYNAATEAGFRWNDPDVGVDWRVEDPILSERDQTSQSFAELRARIEGAS